VALGTSERRGVRQIREKEGMTNSNTPARQQGDNIISRKFYYDDYEEARVVAEKLQQQGAFRHISKPNFDEDGTFVVIRYLDPMVVPTRPARRPSTAVVPRTATRQLALPQRAVPATKPVHKRWWFIPSIVLAFLAVLCGVGYWAFQQLKQVSVPAIGTGVIGFLFVVVLVVAIVKRISGGGGGKGHSGGYGFHYGPCD
jgi:hypothetical protein